MNVCDEHENAVYITLNNSSVQLLNGKSCKFYRPANVCGHNLSIISAEFFFSRAAALNSIGTMDDCPTGVDELGVFAFMIFIINTCS